MYVFAPLCLLACMFVCLFVCLVVCLFVCLSVCEQLNDHSFSCGVINFQRLIAMLRSGSDSFLKGLGQKSRSRSTKGQIHLNGYNFACNCHRDFKLGSYFGL